MTQHDSESSVERLIKLAGERDMPSPEGMQRARATSEVAWRQMLAQPTAARRRRGALLALGFALAASLALAAWLVLRPAARIEAPLVLGHVVALEGAAPAAVYLDAPISSGSILETSQGRVAIAFGTAVSLRLDHATRVRFEGGDHVTLLAGSMYVDSGGLNVSSPLRVTTPAGEVSHVGTQFQVYVADSLTRVRVREGRVLVESRDGVAPQDLATGDELEIRGAHSLMKRGLTTFGADWEWAADVAPVLEIENRPLAEFLAWLVREQGWQLRYASDALQEQARDIRLHGALDGLDSAAMLERVSLVTGVALEMQDGVLWVGQPR